MGCGRRAPVVDAAQFKLRHSVAGRSGFARIGRATVAISIAGRFRIAQDPEAFNIAKSDLAAELRRVAIEAEHRLTD